MNLFSLSILFNKISMKIIFFVFLGFLMAGCSQDHELQKIIKSTLKDPDSAKFGEVLYYEDIACYEVNAKNSMGGYTGTKVAFLMEIEKNWNVIAFEDASLDKCISTLKKIKEKEMRGKRLNENVPLRCVGSSDMEACIELEKKLPLKNR